MQIGLDSYSFHIVLAAGRYDVFRTLDWLAAHGFTGIQLNINGPRGRFLGGDPADATHVRRVRRKLESLGFFAEIGGNHATDATQLTAQLELAAAVGADVLRTLVGLDGTMADTIARTREAMAAVLPLARRLGVRIAIENHEDITSSELRQLLDALDDPAVGACLDTGNDIVVYGDPVAAARALAPKTVTTHIKDHKTVRVAGRLYSVGTPLGAGDIDLSAILRVIRRDAPLDRLLLQNTLGYAATFNPFHRADLPDRPDPAGVPNYPTVDALQADGLYLDLSGLAPAALQTLAANQPQILLRDLDHLRGLLAQLPA